MTRVHVVGAGLAGLAAAVRLAAAGRLVTVYESSGHAGGRCRSFHDSVLGAVIDNGNHMLLSGNRSVMAYLDETGAADPLSGPGDAAFPFVDLASGARWTVRPNAGPVPWWILCPGRRPPGTRPVDFLAALRLRQAGPAATVEEVLGDTGALYARFWEPLAVAALNTPADRAAAAPLWQVLTETFAGGAALCRPLAARTSLSDSFVTPALSTLAAAGADIRYAHRLKGVERRNGAISYLDFSDTGVVVQSADSVILALPPAGLKAVFPDMALPDGSHAIVNAHFRLAAPLSAGDDVSMLGLVGGLAHWLFIRGDIVSVTVSAADELALEPADSIACRLWRDVCHALDWRGAAIPPYRIVKERRATFSQTPAAMRLRAKTRTATANLYLAGDWTDTGLPATIESAIRSGHAAAQAVLGG
ncbi:MAG: hydroxysqualene dehydroxylase HpnE [Alphaproteobacteria bacterium]